MRLSERLQRVLPENVFARGVTILVGGTAGAQILLVLAAPVLTRLYTPEDFGLLAVYASLLALIGVIASLRYELAIPLPEDEVEAANVAVLCLILVGLSTLLTGVLVLLLGSTIAEALGVPILANYLWLLPVGVLLSGTYSVFNYWAVRTKRFTTIAGTKLRQALATIVIQLAAFKLGGIALLCGQVAGQGVGTTRLGRSALASAGFRQVSWRGIMKAAGRYRRFPIFSTWTGLSNTASLQLAPLLFAAMFGAAVAGVYALTLRVLSVPASLIGDAVGKVFLSEAPKASRENRLTPLVENLHMKLALAGVVPLAVIMLAGPFLFEFVFGSEWRQAGVYAQWMAPWIYLQFQWSPLSMLASILELQKEALISQIIALVVRVGTVMVCYMNGATATETVLLFAVASAFIYLGRMLWFVRRAGCNSKAVLLRESIIIGPIVLLAYFLY